MYIVNTICVVYGIFYVVTMGKKNVCKRSKKCLKATPKEIVQRLYCLYLPARYGIVG